MSSCYKVVRQRFDDVSRVLRLAHPFWASDLAARRVMLRFRQGLMWILMPALWALPSPGRDSGSQDVTNASLEQLMNIEVTSVSKKEQKLSTTAAAVFVLTQEDIRRSGATNIPDLLRMVPGVDVAQIDANTWAISIRGFNTRFSNKVLVLVDGRAVYTPAFSGVFWDQQTVPLEDIDRIEVIRGPGATVWGANAMNGVINIITKSASATQGGLISGGVGSEDKARGFLRYGGKIGLRGTYRVFGNYFDVGNLTSMDGREGVDGWHSEGAGFRSDWDLSPRDSLSVEGDVSMAHEGQTAVSVFTNAPPFIRAFNAKIEFGAGDLLGRWNHTFADGSAMTFQAYYDTYHRTGTAAGDDEIQHTVDFDFQHHFLLGSRQDIVWGLGYRSINDHLFPGNASSFAPPKRNEGLFSAFVQDEIRITNWLEFTLGSRFEHNSYTGFEYEPGARLAWHPTERHTVWTSASQAIRQPSSVDTGLIADVAAFTLENGKLGVSTLFGNPHFKVEQLRDYEVGYRAQLTGSLSLDVAMFLNVYRHLQTSEPGTPYFVSGPGLERVVFPLVFDNKAHARNHGAEVSANWNVNRRWRITSGYSVIHMNIDPDPSSHDPNAEVLEGETPKHMFQVRSLFTMKRNVDFDSALYYVNHLPDGAIPSYARLDTRLAWRIGESLELSAVGQNLLRPRHLEFNETNGLFLGTQVERSVFGRVTWRF